MSTTWLLARERAPVAQLRPPAGTVAVRHSGEESFVAGRPEWGPQYEFRQLPSAAAVEAAAAPAGEDDMAALWAWADEAEGTVRARVFPVAIGIAEDEATGAAAVQLAALLGRELAVHQGQGSVIRARPAADGWVEIGGRTVLDEVREQLV